MSRPVAIDFPDADVIVGTGWQTANVIHNLPPEKGRKFFFVQDYEHWVLAEGNRRKDIREAFALPMMRISSSPAVSQMLENMELTFECELCPRLDLDCYDMDCSPESRDSFSVGLPVRSEGFKGTTDGLTTASILKDHFGERVTIRAFGAIQRPDRVPPWIDYLHYPSDRELRAFYNSIAIFIFPSHVEGWGLPAMESMRCGAAVVSADCIGVRAFIRDGVNGVIVPRKNPTLMAAAVGQLMRDNRRRCNLAHAAYAAMDKFSWAAQINRLQSLLVGPVRGSC